MKVDLYNLHEIKLYRMYWRGPGLTNASMPRSSSRYDLITITELDQSHLKIAVHSL